MYSIIFRTWLIVLGLSCCSVGLSQLTIIVDQIPAHTPPQDPIHIAGDFQGWEPGSIQHILTKDTFSNTHSITLAAGFASIEFKFTRGSWQKVESDANGNFLPNREWSGNDGDTIMLQILGWEDLEAGCNGGGTPSGESTASENVQVFSDTFYMPQFDRCRRIWVYLPPDYGETDRRYPVLYMHDGQNVFDDHTSFISEWEVDETLNGLHAQGDTGIIVVGIDNGGILRTEEYTPWVHPQIGGGEGALYTDFIVETLKPVIDSAFRTLPGREHTGLMGSSLGGLISTYGGIEYQEVFSKVGSFSPSYWWSEQAYAHVTTTGRQEDMRIYQLMGALEGADAVNNMLRMEDTLHAAGFEEDNVLSVVKADGEHTEWFWAREFEDAFLWLFRDVSSSREKTVHHAHEVQAYPNPGSDHVILAFELAEPRHVTWSLFDPYGKRVVNGSGQHFARGTQQITVDTASLPMGYYVCRLSLDGMMSIIPFIIIK